jgi:hypothetical protein
MFKDKQRKNRVLRREYLRKYRKEQLEKLSPEERNKKIEKSQKRKERLAMKETELFEDVMEYRNGEALTLEQEFHLRKMIRRDVKIIQKQEDKELGISEESDDQHEWEEKINHKVQYGTDTDSELEEAYLMEVDKRRAAQLQ